jgi:hypothetical protein
MVGPLTLMDRFSVLLSLFCADRGIGLADIIPSVEEHVMTQADIIVNVAIFWDIAPCNTFVKQRFGRTHYLHLQGLKSAEQQTSVQQVARLQARLLFR